MAIRRTLTGFGHVRTLLNRNASRNSKILAGLALAYTLWPIDLLPDFIPIIGQLDDLIAIAILLNQAYRMIKERQGTAADDEPQPRRLRLKNVIDVGR